MRKVITFLSTVLLGSLFQVQAESSQLFDCVNPTSLAVDGKCVEKKIDQNRFFVQLQDEFAKQQAASDSNVVATMILDQQKMQIDIVAHQDSIKSADLLVANKSN